MIQNERYIFLGWVRIACCEEKIQGCLFVCLLVYYGSLSSYSEPFPECFKLKFNQFFVPFCRLIRKPGELRD